MTAAILVTSLWGCGGATPPADPPDVSASQVLFRGVQVFDGERSLGQRDVLVRAGLVAEVAPRVAPTAGAQLVDGTGLTLLPGLIDSHTHNGGDSLEVQAQFGVTTTIDMAASATWAAARRAEQRGSSRQALQRADLVSPGPPATVPGGHGTEYGGDVPTLQVPGDVPAWMADRKREGADFVKVIHEHGHVIQHPTPTFDAATLTAVVAGARAAGLRTVAHTSTVEESLAFVRAGGDGLAHVFHDRTPTAEERAELRGAGTFVVATLTVYAPDYGQRGGAVLLDDPAFLAPLSAERRRVLGKTRRRPPQDQAFADRPVAAVRELHAAGVPILAGSDAPNEGTAWGASLHHELELLVVAGLTPSEALTAATAGPARAFGLSDRGRIARGLRADLLLVQGDPTTDIRATRRIVGVWKRGVRIPSRPAAPDDGALAWGTALDGTASPAAGPATMDVLAEPARVAASSDVVSGGTSSANLSWTPGPDPRLRVATRVVTTPGVSSWAGAIWWPAGTPFAPADLSGRRLELELRGDGHPVRLMVFTEARGASPTILWLPTSAAATRHAVTLDELDTDGRRVTGVLLSAAPDPGERWFEVGQWRIVRQ